MEESFLYEVIFKGVLCKWRDKIDADDDFGFGKQFRELENAIHENFTDKEKDLILSYGLAIENHIEYIRDCLDVKLINLCVKMGMQIEKSFGYKKDSLNDL